MTCETCGCPVAASNGSTPRKRCSKECAELAKFLAAAGRSLSEVLEHEDTDAKALGVIRSWFIRLGNRIPPPNITHRDSKGRFI